MEYFHVIYLLRGRFGATTRQGRPSPLVMGAARGSGVFPTRRPSSRRSGFISRRDGAPTRIRGPGAAGPRGSDTRRAYA